MLKKSKINSHRTVTLFFQKRTIGYIKSIGGAFLLKQHCITPLCKPKLQQPGPFHRRDPLPARPRRSDACARIHSIYIYIYTYNIYHTRYKEAVKNSLLKQPESWETLGVRKSSRMRSIETVRGERGAKFSLIRFRFWTFRTRPS